jgi:hypothetical protein
MMSAIDKAREGANNMLYERAVAWASIAQAEALERIADRLEHASSLMSRRGVGPG